jgi:hypothetical protein
VWPWLHEALLAQLRGANALDFSRAAAGVARPRPAGQFDPAAFDLAEVNTALSGFAAVLIKN